MCREAGKSICSIDDAGSSAIAIGSFFQIPQLIQSTIPVVLFGIDCFASLRFYATAFVLRHCLQSCSIQRVYRFRYHGVGNGDYRHSFQSSSDHSSHADHAGYFGKRLGRRCRTTGGHQNSVCAGSVCMQLHFGSDRSKHAGSEISRIDGRRYGARPNGSSV